MFADFSEDSILIVVEAIFPVVGDVDVFPSIVVVIADACPLTPARSGKAGLRRDVGEGTVVIVVEEMIGWGFVLWETFEGGAVYEEDLEIVVAGREAVLSLFGKRLGEVILSLKAGRDQVEEDLTEELYDEAAESQDWDENVL